MPTAFVLLNTEVGSEADVLRELRKIESIEEALPGYTVPMISYCGLNQVQ